MLFQEENVHYCSFKKIYNLIIKHIYFNSLWLITHLAKSNIYLDTFSKLSFSSKLIGKYFQYSRIKCSVDFFRNSLRLNKVNLNSKYLCSIHKCRLLLLPIYTLHSKPRGNFSQKIYCTFGLNTLITLLINK